MAHERFDIWEEHSTGALTSKLPWRAQLINQVAYFPTKESAERFVAGVQKARERLGLK